MVNSVLAAPHSPVSRKWHGLSRKMKTQKILKTQVERDTIRHHVFDKPDNEYQMKDSI
jgi:hypothetical protein